MPWGLFVSKQFWIMMFQVDRGCCWSSDKYCLQLECPAVPAGSVWSQKISWKYHDQSYCQGVRVSLDQVVQLELEILIVLAEWIGKSQTPLNRYRLGLKMGPNAQMSFFDILLPP